jgi:hypothetical protein
MDRAAKTEEHKLHTLTQNLFRRDLDGLHKVPEGYPSWYDAIQDYVVARGNNDTPDTVEEKVWKTFETLAFVLAPKISV